MTDGLSDNTVFRITQDKKDGYLWLGTDYGLSRFDGITFKKYFFDNGLSSQSILSMSAKANGSLILGYYRDGLYQFSMDSLSPISTLSSGDSLSETLSVVIKSVLDGQERLLMSSQGRLILLEEGKGRFADSFRVCYDLCSDHKGGIYISHELGISHFTKGQFVMYPLKQTTNLLQYKGNDQLVFSQGSSVYLWNIGTQTPARLFSLSHKKDISVLLYDSKDRLWCSTHDGGLYCYQSGKIDRKHHLVNDSTTIVNNLYEDQEGNIWTATNSNGIFGIFTEEAVRTISDRLPFRSLLKTTEGDIYAGAQSALFKWSANALSKHPLKLLHSQTVYDLAMDTNNQLLVASNDQLTKIGPSGIASTPMINGSLSISEPFNNQIWIGTFHGLYRMAENSMVPKKVTGTGGIRINQFFRYRDSLWGISDIGLFNIDDEGNLSELNLLPNSGQLKIHDIVLAKDSALIIASTTGLYIKNKKGETTRFTTQDGLPANYCYTLEKDLQDRIWIGTHSGLAFLDTLGKINGLNHLRTLSQAKIRDLLFDDEETLWLACETGLYTLNTSLLAPNIPKPIVLIDELIATSHDLSYTVNPYEFHYQNQPLEISFHANSFKYGNGISYQYRLANQTEQWSKTKARRVTYASLAPGEYTFEVRANHESSQDFSIPNSVSFYITPPFWMTTWFKALCLLTILSLSVLGSFLKSRSLRKKRLRKAQVEERINQLKFQALSAMMSPHFVQNVLSSIILYAKDHTRKDAVGYIEEFSELIRLNLRHVQDSYIELDDEVSRLQLYLNIAKKRFNNRFDYQISIAEEIDPSDMMIPNMVVQPFVENALWHGILPLKTKGTLSISFKCLVGTSDFIEIMIVDNGIGINSSKEMAGQSGNSLGIKTTTERIHLLNNNNGLTITELVNDETGKVSGTKVQLKLKV